MEQAIDIVLSYDTGVTLRQLFYRLVSEQLIPNTSSYYINLSTRTAKARRNGEFPDLIDRTSKITVAPTFTDPEDAKDFLGEIYRRDRTEGQRWSIYLAIEKDGMVTQLDSWFGDLGLPIVALGGYASQTYKDDIRKHVVSQGRPAVLLYAGDLDPEGEDIERDLVERTNCWAHVERVALTPGQVAQYSLPENPGKPNSTRADGFIAKYGHLFQIELDALPPDVLRSLYQDAIDTWWDDDAYQASLEQERQDLTAL